MKAFLVHEPLKYELAEVPLPEIAEDEILVKVGACSICHSDLDIIDGTRKHGVKFPLIPGHEFAGTIEKAGKLVKGLEPGDRIICQNIVWCGYCRNCRRGNTSLCLNYDELGTTRNGGFAEYAAIPLRLAQKFHKITMDQASNVEPAGNAFHAVELAAITPGDCVVVIGPGPIGLYALQIAKLKSPGSLIMIGTRDDRLDTAKKLGATHVINVRTEDAVKTVMQITDGMGADKVIQCATTKYAIELALQIAGTNSRIVIEGFSDNDNKIPLNFNDFIIKPMCITGAAGVSMRMFEDTLILMENGLVDAEPIITHRLPLAKIEEGLNMLKSKNQGVIKIVVNP